MEWLNYHHLFYFWTVAREGSISRACAHLRLAQPTISGQIRSLENSLGEKLFHRVGRKLVLTEMGSVVFRYAEEIFSLGRDLVSTLRGRPTQRAARFHVGIADSIPKLIAYRFLEAALRLPTPVRIVCREDRLGRLAAELALHDLDLILSDAPLGSDVGVRAFSHPLGECGVSFFGTRRLAASHMRGFPKSLQGAPLLLPAEFTSLRRSLESWFERERIRPGVIGEFDDSALMKTFGQAGAGIFPAPSAIEGEVMAQYGVRVVGRVKAVRERFYAITLERRLKHPGVVAISEAARRQLL